MPYSPAHVEKINHALSALCSPFDIFRIDPAINEQSYEFVLKELVEHLDDSLRVVTRYIEKTDGDDPVGVARMLSMLSACFGLYRALVENRPFQPQSGKSPLEEARAAARDWEGAK